MIPTAVTVGKVGVLLAVCDAQARVAPAVWLQVGAGIHVTSEPGSTMGCGCPVTAGWQYRFLFRFASCCVLDLLSQLLRGIHMGWIRDLV